jgi:hypothetical protein
MKKKVFVFLPDGVGLRNFALSEFKKIGESNNVDITYWNNTEFSLKEEFDFNEVFIKNQKIHYLTPIYSRVRKRIELNAWEKKHKDPVYPTYKFPLNFKGVKNIFKSILIKILIAIYSNPSGVEKVREKIKYLERKSPKYLHCKKQLEIHQPDIVFCTNQRATQAISALLAAKDLNIPTVSFIYSWDNVPKAMKVVETNYYFVWSNHMKEELLFYYPYIKENQVFVTGTPQFEPHYDTSLLQSREGFFKKYNLDLNKKYICFSGDDITTSPLDQYYLEDLAIAVRELNAEGYNLGIIYRKCPVDFTDRYDKVLHENKDIIVSLAPLWNQTGDMWNQVIPSKADFAMLVNVSHHCELVANVCSSTVFDFVIHEKPCIYFNYEQPQLKKGIRDIGQNYKYVHFRSMPSKDAVAWACSKAEVKKAVHELLEDGKKTVINARDWYTIIVGENPTKASQKIWDAIEKLIHHK